MIRSFRQPFALFLFAAAVGAGPAVIGCSSSLDRDAPQGEVHVVFDPQAGRIPVPNDLLRDKIQNHLTLPVRDDMKPAEAEFRRFMNTLDAWPTTFPLAAEVSAPVDPKTVGKETVLLYRWEKDKPVPVTDLALRLEQDNKKIAVDAPRAGWVRGARYVMLVRGGRTGVKDVAGQGIGPDKTFHFLRARAALDTVENNRAFPGDTREERIAVGKKLEAVRAELAPFFDGIEAASPTIVREDVAALWSFSITREAELAMDRVSQRVPLPFDVLVNTKTSKVDLAASTADSELEQHAKAQLNELDGFGVSTNLAFELTVAVDPATATKDNVKVFRINGLPREVPVARVRVLPSEGAASCTNGPTPDGCLHLIVDLEASELPLEPKTTYAVVVKDGLRARGGGPIRPMLMGHFLRAAFPLVENGESTVLALSLENAEKLERVRKRVDPLLKNLGRDKIVAAWSFTTLDAAPELRGALDHANVVALDPAPTITKRLPLTLFNQTRAFDSLFPDPLIGDMVAAAYGPRINGVKEVIEGTIDSPYLLDRQTRQNRADGSYERERVKFVLALPERPKDPNAKIPVVIFGHGLVTDRRFVLTVAGALAKKGFASIAIDYPFHGDRSVCLDRTLIAFPNFVPQSMRGLDARLQDDLLQLPPCPLGASCVAGKCMTPGGVEKPLGRFPVMDLPIAGGSALLDVEDIPHIKDRFLQALVDVGSLHRSLKSGTWTQALGGIPLATDRFYYTGQSLGGIMGAVFVALTPDIERAVLNVPGADMVDLFTDSTMFGPQMAAYFKREKLEEGSYKKERLLNVAKWLIDSVDPHSVGQYMTGRNVVMQMDKGDMIIPNHTTQTLQRVAGLRMKTYPSPLHADLVIPVIGDPMLNDLVQYLSDPSTAF